MKKILFVFTATILLAAGCGKQSNVKDSQQTQSPSPVSNTSTSAASNENLQNAGPPIYQGRPIFVGMLQVSNNLAKGNLMLLAKPDLRMAGGDVTKDTTLYIKTQRDYSNLIGKKVLAGFIGDSNNHINSFSLIDIVEDTGQSGFPK